MNFKYIRLFSPTVLFWLLTLWSEKTFCLVGLTCDHRWVINSLTGRVRTWTEWLRNTFDLSEHIHKLFLRFSWFVLCQYCSLNFYLLPGGSTSGSATANTAGHYFQVFEFESRGGVTPDRVKFQKYVPFYLYSPKSQITACLRSLTVWAACNQYFSLVSMSVLSLCCAAEPSTPVRQSSCCRHDFNFLFFSPGEFLVLNSETAKFPKTPHLSGNFPLGWACMWSQVRY